jgi:hypothetical protein
MNEDDELEEVVEDEEEEISERMCLECNGSGEGMFSNKVCLFCHGTGVEVVPDDEE